MAVLLITHDLGRGGGVGAARSPSLYAGRVVETGSRGGASSAPPVIRIPRACCSRCPVPAIRARGAARSTSFRASYPILSQRPHWLQLSANAAPEADSLCEARRSSALRAPERPESIRRLSPSRCPRTCERRERETSAGAAACRKYVPACGGQWVHGKACATLHAVEDVDIDHRRRARRWDVVGESGCGKSTLGRLILRLDRGRFAGQIEFDGARTCGTLPRRELRALRRRHVQVIFQDPYASLNPRMTVGEAIGEGLLHPSRWRKTARSVRRERGEELLEIVGHERRARTAVIRTSSAAASASGSASRARWRPGPSW